MKHFLTILLLITASICSAQINFTPGYFISNNGSKTECLIKDNYRGNNRSAFEYKLSEDSEVQTRTISDVKEFTIGEDKYIRFTAAIDRSSSILSEMSNSPQVKWTEETVYLRVLSEGKLNVYQFTDDKITKYFFSIGNHAAAEQLLYRQYTDGPVVKENVSFRQQLYNLMQDKINDMKKFERIRYSEKDLTELFDKYNDNTAKKSQSSSKSKFHLKVAPGVGFAKVLIDTDLGVAQTVTTPSGVTTVVNPMGKLKSEMPSSVTYRIGIEAEHIFGFTNNKWSAFADVNYQMYKNTYSRPGVNWDITYNFTEASVGIRHYMFLTQKSKIFIDAAYNLQFAAKSSKLEFTGTSSTPVEADIQDPSYSVSFDLGYSYDRYSAQIRYTAPRHLESDRSPINVKYSGVIGFILAYRIF